jgi:hypothetical protein
MNNLDVLFKFLLIIALILSLIIISGFLRNISMNSILHKKTKELWTDLGVYLSHPTKSFSAEMAVPQELRLLQQPTKCFSCERQLKAQHGLNPNYLYRASPTKCFSCERQILNLNRRGL